MAGFQYKGQLSVKESNKDILLSKAGITGICDSCKIFKNSADTGTILIYFTETGIAQFSDRPANELFNMSISLDNLFDKNMVAITEEKLASSATGTDQIKIIEDFLSAELKERKHDRLIGEAIGLIYRSKGAIRINELNKKLFISQSSFEKRFRKSVGASPKKFASIVRFNAILKEIGKMPLLTELCYKYSFFDQAHFIKDFKQYSGDTPENFKRLL